MVIIKFRFPGGGLSLKFKIGVVNNSVLPVKYINIHNFKTLLELYIIGLLPKMKDKLHLKGGMYLPMQNGLFWNNM